MRRTSTVPIAVLALGMLAAPAAARAGVLGTERISGAKFESLAQRAIANVAVGTDSKLVAVSAVRDQFVTAGRVSLLLESPLVTPSYVNVPIDIDVNGTFVRTVFVGYRVQQYVRTAVAAHDLVAGSVLEPGDLRMARIPSYGRLGNGTTALIGRKIFSTFRKGQPVYLEETQVNQIVQPGSSVVLVVNDGGVSVVAEAVARTGGGLGDEVNVYNPSTNRTLSGMVVGPDRVQLDIMGGQ